jgi:hypothetical protein
MKEKEIHAFLDLVDLMLDQRNYSSKEHKKNDYDNIFFYLLDNKDITDPYERRLAGIEDKEWEDKKQKFLKHIS